MLGNFFMTVCENTLRRGAIAVVLVGVLQLASCSCPWNTRSQPTATKSEAATAEVSRSMPASTPTRQEPEQSSDKVANLITSEPADTGKKQDKPVAETAPDHQVKKYAPATVAPHPVAPKPKLVAVPKTTTEQAKVHVEEKKPPPLDLDFLEKSLRKTSAIGVFTKLALKNQVDDLLDKFRAFYQGRSNVSLSQLRQNYEMLIMKVLALLQDRDPTLARDILDSREAIWKVLADPAQFASA